MYPTSRPPHLNFIMFSLLPFSVAFPKLKNMQILVGNFNLNSLDWQGEAVHLSEIQPTIPNQECQFPQIQKRCASTEVKIHLIVTSDLSNEKLQMSKCV
jgi:hypothetical protein